MCGIIGYLGGREATPILMESLKRLEYRGYDSAGVAVLEKPADGHRHRFPRTRRCLWSRERGRKKDGAKGK